jgi:hypothetical protein
LYIRTPLHGGELFYCAVALGAAGIYAILREIELSLINQKLFLNGKPSVPVCCDVLYLAPGRYFKTVRDD